MSVFVLCGCLMCQVFVSMSLSTNNVESAAMYHVSQSTAHNITRLSTLASSLASIILPVNCSLMLSIIL